jgi:hypothetical protein
MGSVSVSVGPFHVAGVGPARLDKHIIQVRRKSRTPP